MPRDRHALTVREGEVLSLIAAGHSNRETGAALEITEGTVKGHLQRIYRKLRVANRTEAALFHRKLEGAVHPPADVDP